jgi:hypothetical protein
VKEWDDVHQFGVGHACTNISVAFFVTCSYCVLRDWVMYHSWRIWEVYVGDGSVGIVVSVTPRPRFTHGTHWAGGWVDPRTGPDTVARGKILLPLPGIEPQSPGRAVRTHALYTDWATPSPLTWIGYVFITALPCLGLYRPASCKLTRGPVVCVYKTAVSVLELG